MEAKLQPLEDALTQRFAELASQEQQWETAQHLLIRAYFEKKAAGVAEKDPRAQFPKDVANGLEIYAEKRTAGTRRRLFDYFTDKVLKDENVLSLRQHIAAVQSEHKAKMMDVRTLGTPLAPRKTFVFSRGDFLSPTREVKPGTPAILHTFHSRSDAPDRLDLANWLMAPENPLTPRVAVNQVWEHLFGTGLVRTANDFGVRGAAEPSRAAGLAGGPVSRRATLESKGADKADRHVGDLSAVLAPSTRAGGERPGQRAPGPAEPLPRRGRDRPRSAPRRQRPAEPGDRRPERLSTDAAGPGEAELRQQLHLEGQPGSGSLPSRHVHLLQAHHPASQPDNVRCAGRQRGLREPHPVGHSPPGPAALEQCHARRGSPGAGPATTGNARQR